jgi:hypothetical protein
MKIRTKGNKVIYLFVNGARSSVVIKVLCYKPGGREFETR